MYRAEDTKLGREVAIKVLPEAVASDPERLARFEREARVLASLNHPNIAAIYSLESATTIEAAGLPAGRPNEESTLTFLVMELVEGEDLAQVLARGAIPVEKALTIGLQIAEALEAAHEQAIIHRDLKPANVKVTPQGQVRVLDFGLAKALDPGTSSDGSLSPTVAMSMSPTLTAQMTQVGALLGTAAYMSPEQARGEEVDRRCDIWAFGVLVYELLSGRRLFSGPSTTDVLAAVVRDEVALDSLPDAVPGSIRQLLGRCLDRDPRNRLRDIGEARYQISEALSNPETAESVKASLPAPSIWQRWLPWLVAAAAVAIAVILVTDKSPHTPTPRAPRLVSALPPPGDLQYSTSRGPMALSPDGSQLAFAAVDSNGKAAMAVRKLDGSEARVLPGTEDASSPFWSPDGASLGFFARRKLERIDIDGSNRQVLADAPVAEGGSWNSEGIIIFAPGDWGQPIKRISATGGQATTVVDLIPGSLGDYHMRPSFLPDGRRFVFSVLDQSVSGNGIYMGSLDSPEPHLITAEDGLHATYAQPGYLVFWSEGSLLARKFDVENRTLGDELIRVADQVRPIWPATGLFAVSQNGLLTYLSGETTIRSTELVWVDRQGEFLQSVGPPSQYYFPRISHDGRRAVVDQSTQLADLWIFDLTRTGSHRITYSDVDETLPLWSPDDSEIYYLRVEDRYDIYAKKLSGNEESRLVVEDGSPCDFSPDGRFLLLRRDDISAVPEQQDLWILDVANGTQTPWIATQFSERSGRFSPDGHWIAYSSNESGRTEIYLQSFPDLGETIPVSTQGGAMPVWRPDGQELYYWSADGEIMAASVSLSDRPQIGDPSLLFPARLRDIGGWSANFDVSPDGQRFLLNRIVEDPTSEPLVLIQNWLEF